MRWELLLLAHVFESVQRREKALPAIGSAEHRSLFCREFTDTHVAFEPENLPWPDLDEAALSRLRAVPFWQEVRHTERRAGAIVAAFAGTLTDPVIRDAVVLQGLEEQRHARLIEVMIERYGIDAPQQALEPIDGNLETAFIDFGFGECLDSFLGFGGFKIARESGFLPEEMFAILETLMHEETRHIVFFVNWMAWHDAQSGSPVWLRRNLHAVRFYGRAVGRLLQTIWKGRNSSDGQEFSPTQAGDFLEGFTVHRFVAACCAENSRRMSMFGDGLLKPRFMPALGGAAFSVLQLWSQIRSLLPARQQR